MTNPFAYGRHFHTRTLVGRRAELAEIGRAIRNRGRLFLTGPRRFGKTSLLAAAGAEAARAGSVVLRFDVEAYETTEALAAAILTRAVQARRGPVDRLASLLGRSAPQLRPLAEVDPSTGRLSVAVGPTTSDLSGAELLTGALDAVGQLAAEWGRNVVVVLDEAQAVLSERGAEAERGLAATIHRQPHVGYIVASSAPRLAMAMTSDPGRPFHGIGGLLVLGPVPESEFLDFLERSFRAGGFMVDAGACAHLLERAGSVPYNVQRLAGAAWELLRAGDIERSTVGGVALTAAVVDRALDRVVSSDDPAYMQLWTSLTVNQRKTLRAAIEWGGSSLQSANVSRRFTISPASVQVALSALEDRQLLRRDMADPGRYRLVDPFLAAWLTVAQAD